MATLDRIQVYPVKALDPVSVETARLGPAGSLALDRRWALFDGDQTYVNGKNERAIHRVRSRFNPDTGTLRVREQDEDDWQTFDPDGERAALESWFEEFLGYPVAIRRDDELGYPDDTDASGPTLLSTGTLAEVASWFEDISPTEMRRRLRPNLLVDAPSFWDDCLYGGRNETVAFTVGDVAFEGVNPCQRCVVPERDPETGVDTTGFRERFTDRREATLPDWVDRDWYDHFYRVMVNTRVPDPEGETLAVGDDVAVTDRTATGPEQTSDDV